MWVVDLMHPKEQGRALQMRAGEHCWGVLTRDNDEAAFCGTRLLCLRGCKGQIKMLFNLLASAEFRGLILTSAMLVLGRREEILQDSSPGAPLSEASGGGGGSATRVAPPSTHLPAQPSS